MRGIFIYVIGVLLGALAFHYYYQSFNIPEFCANFISYQSGPIDRKPFCREIRPSSEGLLVMGFALLVSLVTLKQWKLFPFTFSKSGLASGLLGSAIAAVLMAIIMLVVPWLATTGISLAPLDEYKISGYEVMVMSSLFLFGTFPLAIISMFLISGGLHLFKRESTAR